MIVITFILAAALPITSVSPIALGGRIDTQGCHNDIKAGTRRCQ